MNNVLVPPRYTPQDLLVMPDGDRYELVDGALVEVQMSLLSSLVGGLLYHYLLAHCLANRLGLVWPADGGFQCFPDAPSKVRKPDVAFVRQGRLTAEQLRQGFSRVPPDLVAEVVSPNDLFEEVDRKVEEYLRAGVRLVWVVSVEARQVYVHRPDGSVAKVRETGELSGEDVVPGFRCPVRDLFAVVESTPAAS